MLHLLLLLNSRVFSCPLSPKRRENSLLSSQWDGEKCWRGWVGVGWGVGGVGILSCLNSIKCSDRACSLRACLHAASGPLHSIVALKRMQCFLWEFQVFPLKPSEVQDVYIFSMSSELLWIILNFGDAENLCKWIQPFKYKQIGWSKFKPGWVQDVQGVVYTHGCTVSVAALLSSRLYCGARRFSTAHSPEAITIWWAQATHASTVEEMWQRKAI